MLKNIVSTSVTPGYIYYLIEVSTSPIDKLVENSQKMYKKSMKNLLTLAFFHDIIEIAFE